MFPPQFQEYAGSLAASTLFFSNVFFWMQDTYTGQPSLLRPFLHTWSLAVEEQYYLIFPVILIALWSYARRLIMPVFIAGFFCSLALAEFLVHKEPNAAFFLIPTRGWELLGGAFLAKAEMMPGRDKRFHLLNRLAPSLGFLMIGLSFIFLDDKMKLPGFLSLPAVAGTMMIIRYAGSRDLVTRLLSNKIFVGTGLISYSLYLWHQPVFAFARIESLNPLTPLDTVLLIILTTLLAIASWAFVERPFRNKHRVSTALLWSCVGAGALLLLGFGSWGYVDKGLPQRFEGRFAPQDLAMIMEEPVRGSFGGMECRKRGVDNPCIIGDRAQKFPRWAVMGDSHVETLTLKLNDYLKDRKESAYLFLKTGCPVMKDVERSFSKRGCAEYMDKAFKALKEKHITDVIINDRSSVYIKGTLFDNGEGGIETADSDNFFLVNRAPEALPESTRMEGLMRIFKESMKEIVQNGIRIHYIAPVPSVGWDAPKAVAHALRNHSMPVTTSLKAYEEYHGFFLDELHKLEHELPGFKVIYPTDVLCDKKQGRCFAARDGKMYYTDASHLSSHGADLVVQKLIKDVKGR